MIVVRVSFRIRPEGRPEFLAHASSEMAGMSEFPGCQRFQFLQGLDGGDSFTLYEEWQSAKDFESYKASPRFRASGETIFPLMSGKPDTAYYDAAPIAQR